MKIMILTFLATLIILTNLASATYFRTEANITNGSITINQTSDNKTLEISVKTNETANIFTEIKDSIMNFFVQSTGKGNLETDLSGQYEVNSTTDNSEETYSGLGTFSKIYHFFTSILFSGWIR